MRPVLRSNASPNLGPSHSDTAANSNRVETYHQLSVTRAANLSRVGHQMTSKYQTNGDMTHMRMWMNESWHDDRVEGGPGCLGTIRECSLNRRTTGCFEAHHCLSDCPLFQVPTASNCVPRRLRFASLSTSFAPANQEIWHHLASAELPGQKAPDSPVQTFRGAFSKPPSVQGPRGKLILFRSLPTSSHQRTEGTNMKSGPSRPYQALPTFPTHRTFAASSSCRLASSLAACSSRSAWALLCPDP